MMAGCAFVTVGPAVSSRCISLPSLSVARMLVKAVVDLVLAAFLILLTEKENFCAPSVEVKYSYTLISLG
jgi:hypothetical protein